MNNHIEAPRIIYVNGSDLPGFLGRSKSETNILASALCNPCDPSGGPCKPDPDPDRICEPDCIPEQGCLPECRPRNCFPDCYPNPKPCNPITKKKKSLSVGEIKQNWPGEIFSCNQNLVFNPTDPGQHICLASHVFLEKGLINGALLDFANGRVLSLNSSAKFVAGMIEKGIKYSELVQRWIQLGGKLEVLSDFCHTLYDFGLLVENTSDDEHSECLEREIGYLQEGLKFLWLEVTSRCNLNCIHCYADGGPHRDMECLSVRNDRFIEQNPINTNEILQIISDAALEGCRQIQFTGGEPTIHPRLSEMILHARKEGFTFIEVYSNGTLMNEAMLDFFKKHDVHLAASFYSHRSEVHDCITKVPGSCRATLKTLSKIKERQIPLRIGIIAMKQNETNVIKTKKYLLEKKFTDRVGIDALRPCGRGVNDDNHSVQYDSMKRRPQFWADWQEYVKNHEQNSCWHGKLAVSSTGNVMPCIFSRDEILANVRTEPLSKIVKSVRTQTLWHLTHNQVDGCNVCEYRYVCHDCRALSLNVKGKLLAKSPRCAYDPYKGKWLSHSHP